LERRFNVGHHIAVRCRGLTKTYGTGDASVMALRGINLEIHRGELLMLVGPSGCGKTTLISIVAAILNQDSGKCEVLGRDLQHMGQTERARFRGVSIGFVFQVFNLLPALTRAAIDQRRVPEIRGNPGERSSRSGRTQLARECAPGAAQRWPAATRGHRPCAGA
jgi:ABC-type lipoprotein export system ATPase subunit